MKNKKKILFFATLFSLLAMLLYPTTRTLFMDLFAETMGNPVSTGQGCDLSTHHLEYIPNKEFQICVPNEDTLQQ